MNWIEKSLTDLTITTGDGKTYTPNWIPGTKDIEYNVALFEFIEIEGTLAKRFKPKGAKINAEILFQGEGHLDTAKAFEESAADSNPWTVVHPYYGSVLVQPLGMTVDMTEYNVSRFLISLIVTITEDAPKVTLSPAEKILEDKSATDELLAKTYAEDVKAKAADVKEAKKNAAAIYNDAEQKVSSTLDAEEYFNLFNEANSLLNDLTQKPLDAIRKLQAMINAPFQFAENVTNRLKMLQSQLQKLATSIATILGRNSKKLYENNAGTVVGAMAAAAITNYSYSNRKEVVAVVESILTAYNGFITNLDTLQSVNGGAIDSYIPDATAIISLSNLINYTVSSLLTIANGARQERTIYLEEDTNVFPLAAKLYGLKPDDSTINELIDTNEIGLNEMLILRKGRKIVYYV